MRKILLFLGCSIFLFSLSNAQTITVSSPDGGETWAGCSGHSITWTHSGTSGFFNVEYSTNNGTTWASLATNFQQSSSPGSFSWTVPNLSSTQALVRVYQNGSPGVTDQSNATFTITPALQVTAPDGGESWQVGAGTQNITWTSAGTSNYYNIDYSVNAGASWLNIITNTYITSGSYTWTIPNNPSAQCLIRVQDYQSSSCKTDNSNSLFTIAAPTPVITVTTPNGGNTLYIGQSSTINWTSQYAGSFVKIEYSTDNGGAWTTIAASTSNSGSYSWTNIPNTPSNQCLVRVSDVGTPTTLDVSDAVFNIALGTISVTIPNGGESWISCSSHSVTWSRTGTSNYFNIYYSINGGTTWQSLASNYYQSGTNGSFTWTLNNTTTTQARVLVTDYNNSVIRDSSDADFTIIPAVSVTAPNGSQSWQGGTTNAITWTQSAGASNYWTIQYSINAGSTWTTIINNAYITSGTYNWAVPNNPSTQCLVRVYDYQNSCKIDDSDNLFTITAATPVITATSPNGGETRYVGGSYNITWTYAYVSGSFVTIEYSTNNGTSWNTIINSTSINSLSYTWNPIPNTPSTQCLVRISEFGNPSVKDSSNAVFSIVYPYVVVGAPNGGESLNGCSSQNITWSYYGTGSPSWQVQYSLNNGSNWNTLTSSTSSSSYNWNPIVDTAITQALVRVTRTTDTLVRDTSNAVFTINADNSIVVSSPNGAESWQVANPSTRAITWSATGTSYYYNLFYSTNGGSTWTTISTYWYSTSANPTFNWTVPNFPSTNCLIKIEDSYNTCKNDLSDAVFTIVAPNPVITVTSPNGANTYYVGGSYSITWTYQYVAGSFVKIEYSTDNGSTWATITNSTSISSGSYTWTPVPNTPGTQCLVKISEFGNPTVSDSSNAVFNIVYPYVVVTAPNTGVTWQGCTSQNITWNYYGTGNPNWNVQYSSDNGLTWTTLSNTSGASYNWNPIPNTITTSQALVRITNNADTLVRDMSDVNYTISPVTYIIVNSPNGGESWQVNNPSTRSIQWSTANTSYYYNLYYSTNGGSTWTTITTYLYSTNPNPSYTWTVPNVPSANCLIKIEDSYATCKSDQSDAVFTILAPTSVITVNSPNGGNIYYVGGSNTITWSYQYVSGSFVQIDYSINNGASWLPVIASTAISSGSYTWNPIPNNPSTQCLVRIRSTSDTTVVDSSNAVFSIVYPYVIVSSPNGAESWNGCSSQNISWSGYGTGSGPWKVEYSLDSGATWSTLTSSTSSSSYNWNPVPNSPSTKALVKVTKTSDALVKDSSNAVFNILQNTAIILNSPNGGESWQVNNPATRSITWTATGTSYYYNLYYSTNGGSSWNSITTYYYNTSANPTYTWTIPNAPSTNCLFKVEDTYNTCKFDNSDAVFTIVAPTPVITVTSPNGGNTYYVGSSYNINWTYQYVGSSFVKIEYSVNNGSTWTTITNSTSISSGSYTWNPIPNTPGTQCLVKVSEYGNPSVNDSSNSVFSIVYPYVVVTVPNGGENVNGCGNLNIQWNSYGAGSGPWKVESTLDSGATWSTLVSSTSSSSYSWNPVPNTPSTDAYVKVTKTTDALVKDSNNAVFNITPNTAIIVTSPNGGESWQVANPATRSITWTASGTSYYYNLYYSTNGGTSWTSIYTYYYTTSANPTYTWTVPNTPSANCILWIEDSYNSCKFDKSDASFTIVAPTPVIAVSSPNGGETRYVGSTYNITWTYQYVASSFVKIEYSTDNGGTWNTITNSTAISSSYSWTVPNTPSTQCLVRVSEFGNPSVFDESNAVFSIVAPYITVNAPNGGETWNGCTSQSISWSGYGTSGPYMVEYSTDNGVNWITLLSSTSSSSYSWNPVPNSQSNNTLARVSVVSNSAINDVSNAVFTISQQTYIIVNTPNGGESWQVNNPATQTINWAFANVSNYFNIYYSTNGGTSWTTIANYVYATGGNANYTWTIPNVPSTNCLIRVEDYYNTCKYDDSNAPFTIVAPVPYIVIANPNGGNTLYSFNNYNITWSYGYLSSSFVKLDYSIDSGATWISISSSYSNSGSYTWAIPNVNSTKCLVRVTDFGNNATYDISNAVFTIKPAVLVTAPNGGEQLGGCTVTTINWTGESSSGNYLLQYSINGGSSWTTIVSQSFSSGPNFSYNWTLPNTPSDFCLIKITNNSNTSKVDQSDAVFSIVPTLVVTNPSNGGSFAVGSTLNITWSAQGVSNYYNIDYSTTGGSSWTNIAFNSYITSNTYAWTVPNFPSSTCLIKITDYQATCKTDVSDFNFTISTSPAAITLTDPNGGENWTACSVKDITWSANGTSGTYIIEYSSNNGTSWSTVVNNFPSTNGVYSWTLPSATTTQGLIRVKDSANTALIDQSNSAFTISNLSTPGAVAGNTTACQSSTQTYSVALVTGATSYTWSLPSGWTGTSTSNTITASVGSSSGTVSVVANNSCGSSSASNLTVTVTPLPATPGAITGNTSPCTGISQTYSISAVSGATSYSWTLPLGYSGSSSTTNISVMIGSNPGDILVTANNSCGSGSASGLTVTPNGSSLPNQPGNISGITSPCVASSQTFSVAAVAGASSYTWTLPATWTGASATNSISPTIGTAGGTISVTASNSCGTSPAQTLAVGISNVPAQPGTITGNNSVCQNSTNTYSISPVSGATNYSWTLPAGWTGASTSTSIVTGATGSSGNISITANNSCGSSTVKNLAVTVNTPVTPTISVTQSPAGTQCGNTNITFNASQTNGGTPSYQWYKNGTPVGLNASSYSNASWTNGDSVWVVMTTSLTCVTGTAATANKIVLSITPTVTPAIAVSADATSICVGQTVNFTTSVTNGGTAPAYQWRKNGGNIAGATSSTYSTSTANNGDAFTCILTSNAPCASPLSATSNSIAMTVTNNVTPSVSISVSPSGAICAGGSVTFTATPVNGGSSPIYQWTVNGQGAGNNSTFTTTTLNNSDTVRCTLTSGLACVTSATANSNAIIQTVNSYVDPVVTITANNNPICVGQSVTFTATPAYGGSSPSYQWRKNHSTISGATSATYSTSTLADSDTIDVVITSNYACLNTTQDSSNEIIIVVTTSVIPDVTVSVSPDDTVCAGTSVTFTATPMNGGSTPAYQWKKNGANISGATSSSYSSSALIATDVITVVMTSSTGCASPATDTSQAITMQVNPIVTALVSISADIPSPICSGTSVTFSTSVTNGGTTPSYQWAINGTDEIGETNSTFTSASLANTDQVSVKMISSALCATPSPASSNTLTYTVNSLPATPVIAASGPTTFCNGGSVNLTSSSSIGNSWSSGETTQAVTILASGTFTVTVTDGNNCTANSAPTIVTVNENPSVSISHNDVSCNGDTDGGAVASASSGTSPYSYSWSNAATSASITGLSSGTYTVTITDVNSCIANSSVTVGITTSISVNDSLEYCGTENPLAVLTGSPSGGIWTGSAGVQIIGNDTLDVKNTPLSSGTPHTLTYSVGGCSENVVLTITGADAGNDTAVCVNDGIYNLQSPQPAGGTWTSIGNGGLINTLTGQVNPAGLSGVIQYVYTHSGCPDTMNVTYGEVLLTTFSTGESCSPGSDGVVGITAAGGNSPYSYSWSSGGTTSSVTGIVAGSYLVTVTDNGGCSETESITITKDAPPVVTVTQAAVSFCKGDSAIISASGADSYSWSPSANLTNANIASPVAFPDSSITYYVTGTVSGCSGFDSVLITVNQLPAAPVISASGSTNICAGDNLTLSSSSGTGNQWSNGSTTSSIIVGTAGTYSVNVTDTNGCTSANSAALTVTLTPVPTISAGGATTFCEGGNVSLFSSSAIGNVWSTGDTTQTINVDSSGSITVTVTNGSCSLTSSPVNVTVNSLPAPVISPGGSTTFCSGSSVTLSSSSSTGNLWSTGLTSQSIIVNSNGTYYVTVTDTNGCTGVSASTIVIVYPNPAVPTIAANGPTTFCSGGNVILTSSSTVNNNWLPDNQTTQAITVTSSGTYSVKVVDSNGCSATSLSTTVTVNTTPSKPVISASGSTTFCSGGSVTLTSSSSTGNNWSTGSSSQSVIITNSGSYFVTVSGSGCSAVSDTIVVTVNPAPTAYAGPDVTITVGDSTQLNATGGISFSWTPTTGLNYSNIANPVATPSSTTSYIVTVVSSGGCSEQDTVIVTVNPPLTYCTPLYTTGGTNGTGDGDFIDGVVLGSINNTATGATGGPTYTDYTGISTNISIAQSYTIEITSGAYSGDDYGVWIDYNKNGTFSATEKLGQITIAGAYQVGTINFTVPGTALSGSTRMRVRCAWSTANAMDPCTNYGYGEAEDYTVNITVNCGIITVNATPSNATCGNNNGSATAVASGGNTPYIYQWSNGGGGAAISGLAAGIYTVTATDVNSCTGTGSVTISGTPVPTVTASATNVSCNGGNNGSASANPSGGTSPYSYLWSNGGNTSAVSGIVAGSYSVTITDSSSCTATSGATVNQPSAIAVIINGTDVACYGASTGLANASATGGISPYSYLWSNGQTGSSATGLVAGNYSLTVTDNNACPVTENISINNPLSPVNLIISSNDASCSGSTDGDALVSASGGTSGYSYSWSNGQTTSSITGLGAGTYAVTVTDANGCSSVNSATLTEPNAIVLSLSSTLANCNAPDGSASVNASGGAGGFTYLWNNGQTTAGATGLAKGEYFVTVTDANLCTSDTSVLVGENGGLSVTVSSSGDVNCYGGNDGFAVANGTAGTSPYNFLWNDPASTIIDSVGGLQAGTYSVTITDNTGCTDITTITIDQPGAPLTASITSISNVNCFGANDGSATVTANGGNSPYSQQWSSGGTGLIEAGLSPGIVFVTVTDGNGCTALDSATITEPSSAVSVSFSSSTDVTCFGGNDGSAMAAATGGTSAYTFTWSNGETSETATGLYSGNITVTVTDANGCTANSSINVAQPSSAVSVSISSSTDISCFGNNDGTATASATGGNPGYTYNWSTGQTTMTASALTEGIASVTVADSTGCSATNSVTITQPADLVATATSTGISCFGNSDGSASVTVVGGTSGYTFLWSDLETSVTITGLSGGNYAVTVTDANGCTANSNTTVTSPSSALAVTFSTQTNVTCFGLCNGSATPMASGGTSPFSYTWNNGNGSNLCAGTYSVTCTDANGCTATSSTTITQPSSVVAVNITSSTDINCYSDTNGTASAVATGGNPGYIFTWSDGENGATATSLAAGPATVTATDANGCSATSTVTINQPLALILNTSSTGINCFGNANGTATVSPTGGISAYSYLWSNGGTTQTITGLSGGLYSVTVTDANGCTSIASVTVNAPNALTVSFSSQVNVTCYGLCNGSATPNATGGTSPFLYSWSSGNGSNLCAGNYFVTVTDANGCTNSASLTITQPSSVVLVNISLQANVICNGDSAGSATASATGGNSPFSYNWSNGANGATTTGLSADTYSVTATDANGCAANTSVTITQPPAIVATGSSTAETCGTANGSASVSASGGNSSYSYTWGNGENTQTITGLNGGTYFFTVTDANLCSKTGSVVVSSVSGPTVLISQTNVSCFGGNNGLAMASISGGTSPFTYFWNTNPPQTSPTATGLIAGAYNFIITDANCTVNKPVIISQPNPLVVSTVSTQNTQATPCNGTATANPVGGTSPYTYFWNNGQQTQTATGLCSNNYLVTVSDANSCNDTASVFVVDNVGIEEFGTSLLLKIYPNPSHGEFTLEMEIGKTGELTIINLLGEVVYKERILNYRSPVMIDLTKLPGGVYNLRIKDGEDSVSRTLIIE